MDTLALLCNLHADGPATLQRLRRSGCESLVALARIEPSDLATRLDWTVRSAERFLREAALLSQRVELDDDRGGLGEEPEFELETALVQELDGDSDESEHELEETTELEALEPEPTVAARPAPDRVEAVLGAWRELDRIAPPSEPDEFVIPRPEPPPDLPLDDAALEGLGAAALGRLRALGIRSLRELVSASTLHVARSLPAGFTRVKRWQFLAARALERAVPAAPATPVASRPVEPFHGRASRPTEVSDTAGPFA